jgi:hypothetical protein
MKAGKSSTGGRNLARLVAVYFVAQGVAIAGWWLVLLLVPASRELFRPALLTELSLMGFWLADGTAAGSSLLAGLLVAGSSARRVPALWFCSGCMVYAALYCVGISALAGDGWLSSAFMVPAAVGSLVAAWLGTRP